MFVNDLFEKKKPEPEKPRNFVAKNAKMGGAGAHKDKKKAEKQGDVKHKKDLAADLAESNRGYDHGFASPTAPSLKGRREFDEPDAVNNIEISINGRPWKVFAGKGLDSSPEFFKQKQMVDAMCKRKTAETGKKWSWGVTGAPATNEANLATQDKENRFKAIKQRDQKQDQITHQAMNNVNDEVEEGVAETLPMSDAVKVLKHYGAEHFKTTSNELHFYKNGRGLSVDLVWNDDATRSATLSSLNSATRKLKGQGVAEGIDTEELANEVYAEFERIYPNLARRADERTVHAAIMDVLNYGGDSDPGALAQDVARAVKQEMQQGMSEGSELKQAKRKYNQAAKDANDDQVGAGKKIDTMKKSLRQRDVAKQGMAEANLGHVLPWPAFVNKISSAMKAMGWKGQQRKDTGAFMFSTRGQLDDEFYIAIIDNEGNGMFTYALGTVEEGDPHIGEKDTLPITEASVSELMTAIREGFGLGETVSEDQNAYGYEVGQTVKLHNGTQGRVLDIFDDSIEVLLPGGRTVTVDFTDAQVIDEGWKDEADDFTEWSNHVKEKLSKASPEQRLGLAKQLSQLEVKHFGSTVPDTFNRQTGKPQAGLGLTDTVRNALKYFNDEQTGIRQQSNQDGPAGNFSMPFGSVDVSGMENATPEELAVMKKAVMMGPEMAGAAGKFYRENGTITYEDLPRIQKELAAAASDEWNQQHNVSETKSLHKRVKIVKGPDSGKYGYIRQIEHGQYKGAPKRYDIDLEGGGQANNLPVTALRMAKDQQGVSEGKKPDNYHIVNKDGKPASLASYADRASAEKDRDAKHPNAQVRQVGPRGKVKGVSEAHDINEEMEIRVIEMRMNGYEL